MTNEICVKYCKVKHKYIIVKPSRANKCFDIIYEAEDKKEANQIFECLNFLNKFRHLGKFIIKEGKNGSKI